MGGVGGWFRRRNGREMPWWIDNHAATLGCFSPGDGGSAARHDLVQD